MGVLEYPILLFDYVLLKDNADNHSLVYTKGGKLILLYLLPRI